MRRLREWWDRPQRTNADAVRGGIIGAALFAAGSLVLSYGLKAVGLVDFKATLPLWLAAVVGGAVLLLGFLAGGLIGRRRYVPRLAKAETLLKSAYVTAEASPGDAVDLPDDDSDASGRSAPDYGSELHNVYTKPSSLDWTPLFAEAEDRLTVIARCCDDWATDNRPDITAFLRAGGHLDLYIADWTQERPLAIAAEQRAKRFEPWTADVRRRILRTICELDNARRDADELNQEHGLPSVPESRLTVCAVGVCFNYIAIKFDNQDLIFAPYEHFYPTTRAPVLWLDASGSIAEMVKAEAKLFSAPPLGRAVNLQDARDDYEAMRTSPPATPLD